MSIQWLQLGVGVLTLPAAHETVDTWINGFGFTHVGPDTVTAVRDVLRMLIFPGTQVHHWQPFLGCSFSFIGLAMKLKICSKSTYCRTPKWLGAPPGR